MVGLGKYAFGCGGCNANLLCTNFLKMGLDFLGAYNIYLLQGQKVGDLLSPRTGRPPKENPRNCKLNIRLTANELDMIHELADKFSMSRTDAIVFAVETVLAHFGGEK